jgi:hypothetical protein
MSDKKAPSFPVHHTDINHSKSMSHTTKTYPSVSKMAGYRLMMNVWDGCQLGSHQKMPWKLGI